MPTTTTPTDTGCTETDLSATQVFALLANERRRFALHHLLQAVGAVHLGELADQIALWEGEHTRDRYERVATSLVHAHLPKLAAAGVVSYDPDADLVALLDAADALVPHLELTRPAAVR